MQLFIGCSSPKPPVYQDHEGFRFVPPPGWVERARDDAKPARSAHRHLEIPLPPLGVAGKSQERLLVRYDRLLPGKMAWFRLTVAASSSSTPFKTHLANSFPDRHWKRESEEENLEMNGLPAVRVVFKGRWDQQDYLCETIAVRKGEKVYFITASFPASDSAAREQIREAVAHATWE
jgi:hypothetical protein